MFFVRFDKICVNYGINIQLLMSHKKKGNSFALEMDKIDEIYIFKVFGRFCSEGNSENRMDLGYRATVFGCHHNFGSLYCRVSS